MLMENTPQFKFYNDLETMDSPTDRIPTVEIHAMMQEKMLRQHKPVVYDEYELLRNDVRKARIRQDVSIAAWTPFAIFFLIFIVYMVVLIWPEKSYALLLLRVWLSK